MKDGKPACSRCGSWLYGPLEVNADVCWPCQAKHEEGGCPCGDCQRKAGVENFDDPGAFERGERARRLLARAHRCVECGATMTSDQKLKSLACPSCVEKLGTDEATGRWNGVPEPSEDAKKGAA